jgi:hypothetical protein
MQDLYTVTLRFDPLLQVRTWPLGLLCILFIMKDPNLVKRDRFSGTLVQWNMGNVKKLALPDRVFFRNVSVPRSSRLLQTSPSMLLFGSFL